jgi:hypothetical protein
MFAGDQRNYLVDYFCAEMETRGFASPQRRSDVGSMVDKVLAEAKANGWDRLDRPLGTVVLNPDANGEDRQGREFGAVVRKNRAFQWLADGVTPGEVKEYWDHGFISHLCYDVLDELVVQASGIAAMEDFSAEGRDFGSLDEAMHAGAAQVRTLWPIYGTIEDVHLQLAEPDRPLPYEARLWVDKWRFRRFSQDGNVFLQELSSSSSFNAAARRARAADPELASALKRAGLPAPVYGLPPAPRPSQPQRVKMAATGQVKSDFQVTADAPQQQGHSAAGARPTQAPSRITTREQQDYAIQLIAREVDLKIHSPLNRGFSIAAGVLAVLALIVAAQAFSSPQSANIGVYCLIGFVALVWQSVRLGSKYSAEQEELAKIQETLKKWSPT